MTTKPKPEILHVTPYKFDEAITVRELHARLTELMERQPERADQRVVYTVQQDRTPSGRLRPDVYLPVRFACRGWLL